MRDTLATSHSSGEIGLVGPPRGLCNAGARPVDPCSGSHGRPEPVSRCPRRFHAYRRWPTIRRLPRPHGLRLGRRREPASGSRTPQHVHSSRHINGSPPGVVVLWCASKSTTATVPEVRPRVPRAAVPGDLTYSTDMVRFGRRRARQRLGRARRGIPAAGGGAPDPSALERRRPHRRVHHARAAIAAIDVPASNG